MRLRVINQFIGVVAAVSIIGGFGAFVVNAQPDNTPGADTTERRQELRSELEQVQEEIDNQEKRLNEKRQERRSLERDVEILEGEIEKAQLNIRQKDIRIDNLESEIAEKENRIGNLSGQISNLEESLAELVRRRARVSDMSLVAMAFSNQSVSEFFSDIDAVQSLNDAIQTRFADLRSTQSNLSAEKKSLAEQKTQVASIRQSLAAEKRSIEKKEAEKAELAAIARNEERSYQDVLNEKQQRAQQIRNELFALRDTSAIPFGQALSYARQVQDETGVRPAFLLAILRQESNLGENVGTCNRPQDPPSKSWRNIMKPSRDIEPYKRITNQLNLDPNTQPLSCPFGNGWGGAMGPSQFIPSTWESYQNRIANAVDASTPNPWNPEHAFTASGIYLADLGAAASTYSAERRAALKYYSGSNWQSPSVQFYGDQVMQKAEDIKQNMIDPIIQAES